MHKLPSKAIIRKLIKTAKQMPLATRGYPSRGQSKRQELYKTPKAKFFLKQVSSTNHRDCQIKPETGTLAQREFWAFCLAKHIGLNTPDLTLLDKMTTVQIWFDLPDAQTFSTHHGKLRFQKENIFNCALFDWVTGQIDRHDANYLYDTIHQQIILIDSAHSFLKYEGALPDYLKIFELVADSALQDNITTAVSTKLKNITKQQLFKLVPLKDKHEKQALERRLAQAKDCSTLQNLIDLYRD